MIPGAALSVAIEIAKVALASSELKAVPHANTATEVADFIETLSKRLEAMGN